jgi:ABC-type phosphate transport system substrate-binding protein
MSRSQAARIFLKKEEKWSNGFAVTVVDLATDHPARAAFSTVVLGKEAAAVEAYWRKLIFSGMGSPPLKLASDTQVVTFVGKNVGSIGYVARDTELVGAVKELEVTR